MSGEATFKYLNINRIVLLMMILSVIQMKMKGHHRVESIMSSNDDIVAETLPVQVRQFIVDKNLEDMSLFRNLIHLYENKVDPIEVLSRRDQLQQEQDLRQSETHKVFLQIQPDVRKDMPDRLFHLEEIFISRIMDLICRRGIASISYFDYMTFKSIVTERLNGLNELK